VIGMGAARRRPCREIDEIPVIRYDETSAVACSEAADSRPPIRGRRFEESSPMITNLRRVFLVMVGVAAVAAGPIAFFDYVLPHHAVLRIVGTEIKRVGLEGASAKGVTRDVYYIYAEDLESKKPRVFRNEDTGWGFPWYFKFNSADLQAIAHSIAGERGTAIFTYYGWRIQLFSSMPNVIKIARADPGTSVFPWFNVIFLTILLGGTGWLALWIRGLLRRRAPKPEEGDRPGSS
jgi:hypothetical protein